jgi:DNA-directed RNA polymerase subunit RPC12/RpoP
MSADLKHRCHECGGRISYPEHAAGMAIACPHCGKPIILEDVNLKDLPAKSTEINTSNAITPSSALQGLGSFGGLQFSRKIFKTPIVAASATVLLGICLGLFFYLRSVTVTGHLYVVKRDNSVVNIPNTKGIVLSEAAMHEWVMTANASVAELLIDFDKKFLPSKRQFDAGYAKLEEAREAKRDFEDKLETLQKEISKLSDECLFDKSRNLGLEVADTYYDVINVRESPIRGMIYTQIENLRATNNALLWFNFETNLLHLASNAVLIAKANYSKAVSERETLINSKVPHRIYQLTNAANAFVSVSNLLSRAEELRPKRMQYTKLRQQLDLARQAVEEPTRKLMEAETKSRPIIKQIENLIEYSLEEVNGKIANVPILSLRQIIASNDPAASGQKFKSEGARNAWKDRNLIWSFESNTEGKWSLRLPSKRVYHFVTIIRHLDKDYCFYKRVDLRQSGNNDVTLNQTDELQLNFRAWDILGFDLRVPEWAEGKSKSIKVNLHP